VDVGSGAGVPGLPIKIVRPGIRPTLVESVQKKARFVESLVGRLGLTQVEVIAERAETLGRRDAYRDAFDVCTARAVATLPALIELCAPLVRPGGVLALPKSGDVDAEVKSGLAAFEALSVRLESIYHVPESVGLGSGRVVVTCRKLGPTDRAYPRRPGLVRSRPIGSRPS
jgi:16S rRNA (guanine527-N7)-methyltransferase